MQSAPEPQKNLTVYSSSKTRLLRSPKWSSPSVLITFAFLFSFAILFWIQFASSNLVDYDGYYHIKISSLIREHGIPTDFPWLPYTILDESRFTDHHFLFHLLQLPFTYIGDLRLAAKVSAVFFASCTFTFLAGLLRRHRVPYPFLWLVLVFASASPFLYRMSMPRAQSVSLLLQLLIFHLILERRYRSLLAVCAMFVWAYNAFPTVAILAGIGFLTELLCTRRYDFRLILYPVAGIFIGLVVNPYFPNNIAFLWSHIGPKIFAGTYQTSVGGEWYPYTSLQLLRLCFVSIAAFGVALAVTNRKEWLSDRPRLFWMLTAAVYLVLLLKSRRFVEYFPPFAVLALAFSVRGLLRRRNLSSWVTNDRRLAVAVGAGVVLCGLFAYTVYGAWSDVRGSHRWDAYRGAAHWLQANTPPQSIVFHADWDDFPMLFFFNTHNRYIAGLDADFMRLRNEPLYRKYEEITQGRMTAPADFIRRVFRSQYVFTDQEHGDFIRNLQKSGKAVEVYNDSFTKIFKLQ